VKDKRVHKRVVPAPSKPIEVQLVGEGFIELVNARDISVGGIAIFVPHNFAGYNIDAEVQVILTLPKGRSLQARGRIRHLSGKPGLDGFFGIQFNQISADGIQQIEKYVDGRLKEGGAE
jgi:hypothetical protein